MKEDFIKPEEAIKQLQEFHFVYQYSFRLLFITTSHLCFLFVLLSTVWFFSLSPLDILSFYRGTVFPSIFGEVVEWNKALFGVAPLGALLLYIRYANKVYTLALEKHLIPKGESLYNKRLSDYT